MKGVPKNRLRQVQSLLRELLHIGEWPCDGGSRIVVVPDDIVGSVSIAEARVWLLGLKLRLPSDTLFIGEDGGPLRLEIRAEPSDNRFIMFAVSKQWGHLDGHVEVI